jgi:hypothetical protein
MIEAMSVNQGVWYPSDNAAVKRLLSDPDMVSVTVTYDDGSQIIFRREEVEHSGASAGAERAWVTHDSDLMARER